MGYPPWHLEQIALVFGGHFAKVDAFLSFAQSLRVSLEIFGESLLVKLKFGGHFLDVADKIQQKLFI